ncbi:PQQ-binding-like beta-propeller repeat protein [Nonomuraea wenchangensis]
MRRLLSAVAVLVITAILAGDAAPKSLSPPSVVVKASDRFPSSLVPAWSTVFFRTDYGQGPYAFSEHLVFMPEDAEEEEVAAAYIRNTQTGEIKAIIPPILGYELTEAGFTNKSLVVVFDAHESGDRLLVGFNPYSGQELWRTHVLASGSNSDDVTVLSPDNMIVPDGVLVVDSSDRYLIGFDPTTGHEAWRRRLPDSCTNAVEARVVAVILRDCENGSVNLTAINTRTGQEVWGANVALSGQESTPRTFEMAPEGEVVVSLGYTYRIYAPDGRQLVEDRSSQAWDFGGNERTMVVLAQSGDSPHDTELRGIDRHSGRTIWTRNDPSIRAADYTSKLLTAGGLLLGEADWGNLRHLWPFPYFVAVIDPADGATRKLPVPLSSSAVTLVGATGKHLFIRHNSSDGQRVTAYRALSSELQNAPELGGVAPSSWPDACALTLPSDLAVLSKSYKVYPRIWHLDDIAFPKPVRCDFVPPTDRDRPVSLTIVWVARSEDEASGLVESSLYDEEGFERGFTELAPGVHQIPGPRLDAKKDTALIMSGRVIMTLTVHGSPRGLRKIARKVAKNMDHRLEGFPVR